MRYAPPALDSPPALYQPAPSAPFPPTDLSAHAGEERRLCEKASSADWLYFVPLFALAAGSIALDSQWFKTLPQPGTRLIGPSLVGLSWGGMIGGGYLALPKCDMHYVSYGSIEGDVHRSWPIAIALAMLSATIAPVVVGVETGPAPDDWSTEERVMRLVLAGTAGFVGALVPYLLPPKTWRAAKALEKLRFGGSANAAMATYSFSF